MHENRLLPMLLDVVLWTCFSACERNRSW